MLQSRFWVFVLSLLALIYAGGSSAADAPPSKAPAPLAKSPAPAPADQQAASKLVFDVFKEDIAKAKKPEEKAALAKKLLQAAIDEKNVANRYALLTLAKDTAVANGIVDVAFDAAAALDQSYQINAVALRTGILLSLAKTANSPLSQKAIAERAIETTGEAVITDKYDLAKQCSDIALASARRANEATLVLSATRRAKEIASLEQSFRDCSKAMQVLDKNPVDPASNLTVGKFRCLVKGDWDRGLPMLALGSDLSLKTLAEKELNSAANAEVQIILADGWWTLAEKQVGAAKDQMQLHAGKWYGQAAPSLTGLAKARVEKKLKEISATTINDRAANAHRPVNVLKLIDTK